MSEKQAKEILGIEYCNYTYFCMFAHVFLYVCFCMYVCECLCSSIPVQYYLSFNYPMKLTSYKLLSPYSSSYHKSLLSKPSSLKSWCRRLSRRIVVVSQSFYICGPSPILTVTKTFALKNP